MKKISFLFLCTFLLLATSYATVIDTIRHYSKSGSLIYTAYNPTSYPRILARFNLTAPGRIKEVLIRTSGGTGSVQMHVYGNEGGAAGPAMLIDKITPVTINKTAASFKTLSYVYANPVYVDNSQFFIGFDNFVKTTGAGILLGADQIQKNPFCSDVNGGDFYYQYLYNTTNQLVLDVYAFAIDVVMEYDTKVSPIFLQDVTASAGIPTNLNNRSVAWGDYNKDGYQDILVTGKLYKNNGDGTFTDNTATAGMSAVVGGFVNNCFMDMNNDGNLDILCLGGTANYIFVNNGSGGFTTQALTGMPNFIDISSINVGDLNKDNYPDIFVGQLWNGYPNPLPNFLYYNNKNLGFRDTTVLLANVSNRHSRGSSFVDFDNDGDLDLYIANYFLFRDNFYQNNGNGTFTDIIAGKGLDLRTNGASSHGTGVDWADYDNDGDFDLLLPQLAHPENVIGFDHRSITIYNNTGSPNYNFTDTYNPSTYLNSTGIDYIETAAGGAWGDVNSDGLLDFITTAFYGCHYISFYLQKPDHTFELKTFDYGLQNISTGEDACWADYDNDGKLDLAMANNNQFRLYKNVSAVGNSVQISLSSTSANKMGIGAKVKLYAGGQTYLQEVKAGRGVRMQNPNRLFFGLGASSTIDSAVVIWPNGNKEKFTGLLANKLYTLQEGGQITIGIDKIANDNEFSVYPNPFSDAIIIQSNSTEKLTNATLEIFNTYGQQVVQMANVFNDGANSISWNGKNNDGNSVTKGVYFYSIKADGYIKTGKFIKQ